MKVVTSILSVVALLTGCQVAEVSGPPEPVHLVKVTPSKDWCLPNWLGIDVATEDALVWVAEVAPQYGRYIEPDGESPPFVAILDMSACWDREQVIQYLESYEPEPD